MSNRECAACSRATELFLCWDCAKTLKSRLDSVNWLAPELDLTLARQTRATVQADRVGGSQEQRLPFHQPASESGWVLHNTLSTWARDLCETRGIDYIPLGYLPPLPPGFVGPLRPGTRHVPADFIDSTAGIAAWLAHHIMAIASSESAGECFDEISAAVAGAQRVIDRPAGRLYVGPCGEVFNGVRCTADLYVSLSRPESTCPVCGATHSVKSRRDELQRQVRGILGTAAELARLLPWILDAPITRKRITYYANKHMITERHVGGERMFQVGEVIDAHVACEARRAAAA